MNVFRIRVESLGLTVNHSAAVRRILSLRGRWRAADFIAFYVIHPLNSSNPNKSRLLFQGTLQNFLPRRQRLYLRDRKSAHVATRQKLWHVGKVFTYGVESPSVAPCNKPAMFQLIVG